MLVDDDGIDNFINEKMITTSFFSNKVLVFNSVKDALDYLVKNHDQEDLIPNIIFLDLNMPLQNGFDFLDAYEGLAKSMPLLDKKCKIMVLSSSVSPNDIDRVSLNPRVYKYLNKPLTDQYLGAINY